MCEDEQHDFENDHVRHQHKRLTNNDLLLQYDFSCTACQSFVLTQPTGNSS